MSKDGDDILIKAKALAPLISQSLASAKTISHVIREHFVTGVLYYHQDWEWKALGFPLCQKILSNGLSKQLKTGWLPLWKNTALSSED